MRHRIGIVLFGLLTVTLGGCATRYQPQSRWSDRGFSETELQPGLFQIRFSGNEFSSAERAEDLAMLRAAELCLSRGATHMLPGPVATQLVEGLVAGGDTKTTATTTAFGKGRTETVITKTTSEPRQLYRPESGLQVRCVAAETPGGWDAQFLARSLRTKYKM